MRRLIASLVFCLSAFVFQLDGAPPSAAGVLGDRVTLTSDRPLTFLISEDFNGDGLPDLAGLARAAEELNVFIATGKGGYAPAASYAVGVDPRGLASGDFDGDGVVDLVASNEGDGDVSVFLGVGDGTFGASVDYAVGDSPRGLATGEFTGDEFLDIAVSLFGEAGIAVLPGSGDGTFGLQVVIPLAVNPYLLQATDFTGDGVDDLLFMASAVGGYFEILTGDGVGGFTGSGRLAGGENFVTGDLNGDSADLVILYTSGQNHGILSYFGDGSGNVSFDENYLTDRFPTTAVLADFNRDGENDIAVATRGDSTVSLLMGDSVGDFGTPVAYDAALQASYVVAPDVNGDGWPDVVVSALGTGASILFNQRAGEPANVAPSADAGADLTVEDIDLSEDEVVTLDASQSSDGDGSIVSWEWSWDYGNGSATGETVQASFPIGVTPVRLTVTDNLGVSATDRIDIEVTLGNFPPEAEAGDDVVFTDSDLDGFEMATLDASASTDADGFEDIVSFDWSWNGGSGSGETLEATFPVGSTLVTLTVTDSVGIQSVDTVRVDVAVNGEVYYLNSAETAVENEPSDFVAADFDGDGQVDIAVTNTDAETLVIRFGKLDGSFDGATSYPAGIRPDTLVSGYFDDDALLDLVVAENRGSELRFFKGLGDGGFLAYVSIPVTDGEAGLLTAGDLNNDGWDDVVFDNRFGEVSVWLSDGAGGFVAQAAIEIGRSVGEVILAHLDGDAFLDMAYSVDFDNIIKVHFGLGDGGFGPADEVASGLQFSSLASDDFNADGISDLAVLEQTDDSLKVFLGKAEGGFEEARSFESDGGVYEIETGDFDGDGAVDIVVTINGLSDVNVYYGTGSGSFGDPVNVSTASQPSELAVADVNRDGVDDFLVLYAFTDVVTSYYIGQNFFRTRPFRLVDNPGRPEVVDLNGDEWLDLLIAGENRGGLVTLLGAEGISYAVSQNLESGEFVGDFDYGDFTNDGIDDLVLSDFSSRSFKVYPGLGDGTFGEVISLSLTEEPLSVLLLDFDEDGDLDILTSTTSRGAFVLYNDGSGGVDTFENVISDSVGLWGAQLLDVNKDAVLDLIWVGFFGGLKVMLGLEEGGFAIPVTYNETLESEDYAVGDLNADGFIDVAVVGITSSREGFVGVFNGNGDGTFAEMVVYPDEQVSGVAIADFNGDGRDDVATARLTGTDALGIHYQNDEGLLDPPVLYRTDSIEGPRELVVADFDRDGAPDILAASGFSTDVFSVLINKRDLPLADAGSDIFTTDADLNGGEEVVLDGSGSFRVEGDIVQWVWAWQGGSAEGEFAQAFLPTGVTVVTLTVTDFLGASATDSVTVTVIDLDEDDDGLPNDFEQAIIDANLNDSVVGFDDVTLLSDFNRDGISDGFAYALGLSAIEVSIPGPLFPLDTVAVSANEIRVVMLQPTALGAGAGLVLELSSGPSDDTSWQMAGEWLAGSAGWTMSPGVSFEAISEVSQSLFTIPVGPGEFYYVRLRLMLGGTTLE